MASQLKLTPGALAIIAALLLLYPCPSLCMSRKVLATSSTCDPEHPPAYNCLCKKPCRGEKCLYRCHQATLDAFLELATTPPSGPSLQAFTQNVKKLELYLNDNVTARVYPLGVYLGRVTMADYIATFVHPLGLGSLVSLVGTNIVHFANSGQVAAATADLQYRTTNCSSCPTTNLTIIMFNEFDHNQKVVKADWNFVRLPEFQEYTRNSSQRVSDAEAAKMILGVCGIDATVCAQAGMPGYSSPAQCAQFLTSIPRIAPHGVQGNNLYCRFLHMAYATVDPHHHCPHISQGGGGVCVDQPYNDYYKVFGEGDFMGQPAK